MHALGGLMALALLGACGSPTDKKTAADTEVKADVSVDESAVAIASAGSTSTVSTAVAEAGGETGNGAAATNSGGLPIFAPLYPGAEIRTRVASASSEEGKGSLTVVRTPDAFEKVVAFYDLQAKDAPSQAKMVTNEKDASVRIFGNETSEEGTLVAISRDVSGAGTVIVITSGTGRMAPKDEAEAAKVAASQGVRLQ